MTVIDKITLYLYRINTIVLRRINKTSFRKLFKIYRVKHINVIILTRLHDNNIQLDAGIRTRSYDIQTALRCHRINRRRSFLWPRGRKTHVSIKTRKRTC